MHPGPESPTSSPSAWLRRLPSRWSGTQARCRWGRGSPGAPRSASGRPRCQAEQSHQSLAQSPAPLPSPKLGWRRGQESGCRGKSPPTRFGGWDRSHSLLGATAPPPCEAQAMPSCKLVYTGFVIPVQRGVQHLAPLLCPSPRPCSHPGLSPGQEEVGLVADVGKELGRVVPQGLVRFQAVTGGKSWSKHRALGEGEAGSPPPPSQPLPRVGPRVGPVSTPL